MKFSPTEWLAIATCSLAIAGLVLLYVRKRRERTPCSCRDLRLILICWGAPLVFGIPLSIARYRSDPEAFWLVWGLWGAISLVGWLDILRNSDCQRQPRQAQADRRPR